MPPTVTEALRRFVEDYRRRFAPSPYQNHVLDWLCACQTSALGGRGLVCDCGWTGEVYNSCGNHYCPQCRGWQRKEWLEARQDQLLPVPHFQVVFTLPGVLREIAHDNQKVVYDLLFHAAVDTLQSLAGQRLDAQLGVLAVLHTWAKDLSVHPHVHCLVTAGGLRRDGEAWIATRPEYLFPTRVMAALFRGKVAEGLRAAQAAGQLRLRGEPAQAEVAFDAAVRASFHRRWIVHVEAPEGRPADLVAKYLARYVSGIAISNARMIGMTATHVSFQGRTGVVIVEGAEFVRRFASHILPRRFRRVRYYGLYAPSNVHTAWTRARQLLHAPQPPERSERRPRICPVCGRPVREVVVPGLELTRPRLPPRTRDPP